MSIWGTIAKFAGHAFAPMTGGLSEIPGSIGGRLLDQVGTGAQGAAQSAAHNRGTALEASLDRDRIATGRQAEDRTERDDAWKKIQQAAYVMNGTHDYAPPTLQTSQGARTLPSYGFGPHASTPAEMQGAQGLQAEVMRRLTGGSQLPPLTDLDKYTHQGTFEKIAGLTGFLAPLAGTILNQPRKPKPPVYEQGLD